MEYHITQYDLEQGALEIQYIEEYFGEFPRKKTATEIVRRLSNRSHLILLATASLPDDPGTVVPVSYKVCHEIRTPESDAKLIDLEYGRRACHGATYRIRRLPASDAGNHWIDNIAL